MTFTTTIAASGSYDVTADTARILNLWIENSADSTGNIYVGDVPPPAVVRTAAATSGNDYIDLLSAADALAVEEGMAVTDGGGVLGASTVVTGISGARVFLSVVNAGTSASFAATFTPPDISTSNGHRLAPGEKGYWSAGAANHMPQAGKRIVADGSGATVTITKQRA